VDVKLVKELEVQLVSIVLQVLLLVGVICLFVKHVALELLLIHLQVLPALTVSLDTGQIPVVLQIAILVLRVPTVEVLEQIGWVNALTALLGSFLPLDPQHVIIVKQGSFPYPQVHLHAPIASLDTIQRQLVQVLQRVVPHVLLESSLLLVRLCVQIAPAGRSRIQAHLHYARIVHPVNTHLRATHFALTALLGNSSPTPAYVEIALLALFPIQLLHFLAPYVLKVQFLQLVHLFAHSALLDFIQILRHLLVLGAHLVSLPIVLDNLLARSALLELSLLDWILLLVRTVLRDQVLHQIGLIVSSVMRARTHLHTSQQLATAVLLGASLQFRIQLLALIVQLDHLLKVVHPIVALHAHLDTMHQDLPNRCVTNAVLEHLL
jgi:hypothetical protein